jgi:predicted PurR-regulated permease PerM
MMTVERFLGIIWPMNKRLSLSYCKRLVLISLTLSLIVSFPIAVFTKYSENKVYVYSKTNINQLLNINETSNDVEHFQIREYCEEIWPKSLDLLRNIYNLFLFFIQYIVPVLTITLVYTVIAFKFKTKERLGNQNNREKQKNKVIFFQKNFVYCYY